MLFTSRRRNKLRISAASWTKYVMFTFCSPVLFIATSLHRLLTFSSFSNQSTSNPYSVLGSRVHSFLKQRLNLRNWKPNLMCNLLWDVPLTALVIAGAALYWILSFFDQDFHYLVEHNSSIAEISKWLMYCYKRMSDNCFTKFLNSTYSLHCFGHFSLKSFW